MSIDDLITVDPDILGGTPIFKGTRVPVRTLFEYLENDYSLEEFLECFPSLRGETMSGRYWSALSKPYFHQHENFVRRVCPVADANAIG
jgi:uncharacterized protein (DUF433 family)